MTLGYFYWTPPCFIACPATNQGHALHEEDAADPCFDAFPDGAQLSQAQHAHQPSGTDAAAGGNQHVKNMVNIQGDQWRTFKVISDD